MIETYRGPAWTAGWGPDGLPPDEVRIFRIPLRDRLVEGAEMFRARLSYEEEQRSSRIQGRADRLAYRICRGCLRIILARLTATAPEAVRIVRGRFGKPALDGCEGAKRIEFNVAHSGEVALIAVTTNRRLGIDVERIDGRRNIDLICGSFLAEEEKASIERYCGEARIASFYACWTRKEAAVKALGESLASLSHRLAVAADPDGPARLLRIPATVGLDGWHLLDLRVAPGYAGAVCYQGQPARLSLRQPLDETTGPASCPAAPKSRFPRGASIRGRRHRRS